MPNTELELIQVLILAVVQGLTEFLPVSSSGHLVLVGDRLGITEPGLFLPILLHLGTLAAVLIVYRKDVLELLRGLTRGQWREPLLIVLATLPAVFVGLVLKSSIESAFGEARAAASCLLATAVILFLGDRARKSRVTKGDEGRAQLSVRDAFVIGVAQAVAILPGISRSGSTISVALLLGIRSDRAARFSFLMSIPAICGATVLEAKDLMEAGLEGISWGVPLLGLVVSALVGWASLVWLLAFLAKGAFRWFALYCAVAGAGFLFFS